MLKRLFVTAAISLFILTSSQFHSQAKNRHNQDSKQVPSDTEITLRRSACFGTCPVYLVTVTADGVVVFDGQRFVKTIGIAKGRISQEAVKEIITAFNEIGYFSLLDRYDGPSTCKEYNTDSPYATTSIRINGKKKSILHYYGCRGPKELINLTKLEEKIDKITDTSKWIETGK